MGEQNSILDKIIQSKQMQEATQFNPAELIANLFKNLSTKERDILNRRFGLSGKEKETLEQIGNYYKITRERIRQIESGTIRKLKELNHFKTEIESAEHNISRLLENYGGAMEENHLLDELLAYSDTNETNRQASLFILNNLLNERIQRLKADQNIHTGWTLPSFPTSSLKNVLQELIDIINQENQLLETNALLEKFKARESFEQYKQQLAQGEISADKLNDEIITKGLQSYLNLSKQINQNILGEWGLTKWNTVRPKRMGDKVYLVLRKTNKPLHFTEIANLINQAGFDDKIAYPATIHNELILDDRYVLVGRGIYALKEWGYKTGTVIDIVINILEKAGNPLSKDEIIKRVLEQRIVRKSTILLALTNKDKITKLPDGTYTLKQNITSI